MKSIHRTVPAALVGAALAGGALAAAPMIPAEQHQGSVAFVSGGVGKEEAKAFEQAEKQYPLTLEFVRKTKPHEEFMADVPVTIKDASGAEVLATTASADGHQRFPTQPIRRARGRVLLDSGEKPAHSRGYPRHERVEHLAERDEVVLADLVGCGRDQEEAAEELTKDGMAVIKPVQA